MRYMLLIYDREADWAAMSEQERGQIFQQYTEFSDGIRKSGHYRASDPLQPVSTATTVRVKNGKPITTDGPFAETREQLGGYYIIEAKNLDEATAIAAPTRGATPAFLPRGTSCGSRSRTDDSGTRARSAKASH